MGTSVVDYRAIFENTGAASIVIRQDSLIILVNKKFEILSGCTRKEIERKKKWTEFVTEDDLTKVDECVWQHEPVSDEIKDSCEFRFVDRSGNIKFILAAITEIPSTDTAVMSLLDITKRKLAEAALKQKELELEMKSRSLEDANTTLKVLLKHREEDKYNMIEHMRGNLKKLVMPSIENLRRLKLNKEQIAQVQMIENQLQDLASPFLQNLSLAVHDLTPREIQVAALIKEGMTTKEIAKGLAIAEVSVSFHRRNLRSKLGIINDAKKNLRSYLTSFY